MSSEVERGGEEECAALAQIIEALGDFEEEVQVRLLRATMAFFELTLTEEKFE